ncbi:hypothetical protein AVEN_103029-1 [Araneus ventricosus]|uniref:Uncharacterized protein n=1 Tax=Araneus ventricosus TaxID=182803 RepID=A0A4Y2B7K0_ARAVE|nr:hypothetical protein AVEN_103029-1 [Araneus ventricosus]
MIDFTPAEGAVFVREARPDVFGEEGSFLTIRTMPAVIVVFEGESEFPSFFIEDLGRSRILRSRYFNGLRIQKGLGRIPDKSSAEIQISQNPDCPESRSCQIPECPRFRDGRNKNI